MPFIKRNPEGGIQAVYQQTGPSLEQVPADDPELIEFLALDDPQAQTRWDFMQSDLDFVRVLEDIIEVLIDKGVILFSDLPGPAQTKFMSRRGMRKEITYVETLFTSEEEDALIPHDEDNSEGGFI
ncbi:MAG: hypothetical protein ACO3MW_08395 [Rhodospirillales bacterium]